MLTEYTTPGTSAEVRDDESIYSLLTERIERTGEDTIIAARKIGPGRWANVTTGEFRQAVVAAAKGLIAFGVKQGDAVTIFSTTRYEWGVLDFALAAIGAVSVPIYDTDSAAQAERILNDSEVKLAIADNRERFDRLDSVIDHCPSLKHILMLDSNAMGALEGMGVAVSDEELSARMGAVKADDLATIVYTSGSTGAPKGAELSHRNFVAITRAASMALHEMITDDHPRLLLFLPLAHVFARYMQFFCFAGNVSLGLSGNLKTILADFQAFKPTFILAVPRIFEKIYNAASQKAGSGLKGRVFAGATQVARDWSYAQQSGEGIPLALGMKHALYDKLVYSSIMDVFGGHVEYAVSGGAPLDSSTAHFFNGVGLPLLEGYGMTETCAPSSVNPTVGYKIGTIGLPLQGVTMGVDETGELCIKSPAVCVGYHNHPDVTEQQIVDGWLHTGDLGSIDDDGFVSIVGRKKDLIITAGGKNVSPSEMEASIMTSPVVSQCVVIGDRKPFIASIISLDLAETNLWLESQGAERVENLEEATKNPIVRAEVERAVNKANELVSRAESIRKFEIVPDEFTEGNGLITPSMKARRQAVVEHYRSLIDTVIYVPKK